MISGKTTLLKSKAVSLARSGETVSYIVMGGSEKTESVMSIATRLDFAQYHPKIKVMSQQELTKFYWSFHPSWWSRWPITPSPLSLLKFYIEKEKPQNVMVDELLLQSNWIVSVFEPLSILFSSYFIRVVYGVVLFVQCLYFIIFVQPHRSEPETMHFANDLFLYISLPVLIYIVIGIIVPVLVPPFNLEKTGSLLSSLPLLLASSSSSLWLALHSQPFTDFDVTHLRRSGVNSQKDLEKWRVAMQSYFSVPALKHNLRNCNEVADAKDSTGKNVLNGKISKRLPMLQAPPPRAPPSLPPTSLFRPIFLPVYSPSQTMEALKHAYNRMGRPTTLVLLLSDKDQFGKVKDTLTQVGLNVATYKDPDDTQNCETFLQHQAGVLVTTADLFSGMEAANVIWVTCGEASYLARSNKLRAIKKLCVIDTGSKNSILDPKIANGFKVDGKFARCQWSFAKSLYQCSSHQSIVLCHSCAAVCQQSYEVEFLTHFKNFLYFLIGMLFPSNPCSCPASGQCQLERTSLMNRISLSRIYVVVSLAVFVKVWSATTSPDISYFVLVCLEVLVILIFSIFMLCRPS